MAAPGKQHATNRACVIPGGFSVISLKFCSSSEAEHKLYVKEHKVRDEKSSRRPLDRTLFVLNVPPYCTKAVTERPAEKHGFKVAYIVFENSSSIKVAKSHPPTEPIVVSTEDHPVKTGIQKWIQNYKKSQIQPDKLKGIVDSFMEDYDKRKEEEAEKRRIEEEQQQDDEDGWVKVTKGHKGAKARPHSEKANQRTLAKEIRKKKRKELMNFYTWQHRNTQKEHIAELRKKFEEDKQKIALLRAQRKFKPY
uniref:Ribosomal RNA-processing protein 7 C-terminal domain-containing protein n=1 Tax=Knipowitschia caucasica TaxID=637954 RepID=A0AAV2KFP8_KNICA